MDIKNMVRDFASLGEAKKRSSVYVKAVSLLCAAIVALVLFFMNMTVRGVTDRILVVNTGGEFLQLKSMETDKLYETLLKAHCNAVAYYVNSFDRMSISGNQAQAVFLVEKSELNAIWNKYLNDRAYADAADRGGQLLAEQRADSLAQTADDAVLLDGDDLAALFSPFGDARSVDGLDGVDVDDGGVDAIACERFGSHQGLVDHQTRCEDRDVLALAKNVGLADLKGLDHVALKNGRGEARKAHVDGAFEISNRHGGGLGLVGVRGADDRHAGRWCRYSLWR